MFKDGRHPTLINNQQFGTETINQLNEENRRLRAENNVLQKKIDGKTLQLELNLVLIRLLS